MYTCIKYEYTAHIYCSLHVYIEYSRALRTEHYCNDYTVTSLRWNTFIIGAKNL